MAKFSKVLEGIVNPAPSLLPALDRLNRQISLGLADATGEGEFSEGTFGTLTGSKRPTKPFIIGFIPPDNEVRFIPVEPLSLKVGDVAAQSGVSAPAAGAGKGQLGPNFWTNYVHMCLRNGIDPRELAKVFYSESKFDPSSQNFQGGRLVAQGLPQFVKNTAIKAGGVPPDVWDRFAELSGEEQLPYVETYLKRGGMTGNQKAGALYGKNMGGYRLPAVGDYKGGRGYMGRDLYSKLGGGDKEKVLTAIKSQDSRKDVLEFMFKAYDQNPVDYNKDGVAGNDDLADKMNSTSLNAGIEAQIAAAEAAIAAGAQDQPPGQAQAQAASNASPEALGGIMAFGANQDDPLGNALGRSIQLADAGRQISAAKQTAALRQQIEILQSTPPLVLLVNPKTFSRSYEVSSDSSVKGRYGNIVHNWLERPFTIETSGVTAGQYAVDAEGAGGLTNVNRVHSLSYANLLSLLLVYKNNGRIFAGSESDPGIPILAFTVFIYYDEHIYLGSFDSFSVDDGADKPYNMSYSFKFTVRYDRDVTLPATDFLVSASLPF